MRRRVTALFAVLALVVGLLAGATASAATQNDTACRAQAAKAQPASGVNSAEVLEYNACRFDRLEAKTDATTPAASPTASPTPTAPSSSASPTPSPTRTPTPTPTPTATSTGSTPSPGGAGFPSATTTGVPAGTTLTDYTGPATITTAGTVIDGKKITACLVIKANDVKIRNSLIQSGGCYWNVLSDNGNTGLTLTDVEVDGQGNPNADSAINGGGWTCTRCNLHGTVDGVKAGTGVVLQDSFVHDLVITADSHNDGVQSLGTTSLKVLRNRIVLADGATSAVLLSTGSASDMRNVQIERNLLGGGAFTVYGGYQSGVDDQSKVSNIAVKDNQFTTAVFPRSGAYGPLTSADSPVVVSGNTWADGPKAGQPL